MIVLESFDPSLIDNGYIDVSVADPGSKILLYNLSVINLLLNFDNGSTSILHAGEAKYWTLDSATPQIAWSKYSALNAITPAISVVIPEVYGPNERVEGTYPMSLIYQTNIANPGGVQAQLNTSSVTNDGNPSGTSVVEATQAGAPGSNVLIENDGTVTIAQFIASVLTALFQVIPGGNPAVKIGAASILTEVLGNLRIDGGNLYFVDPANTTISVTGTSGTGKARLQNTDAVALQVPGGSDRLLVTAAQTLISNTLTASGAVSANNGLTVANGITLTNSNLTLSTGSIARSSTFTGAATGTYNHNNGNTPAVVNPFCSVSGSQTMGWDNPTTTQVHITSAAGLSFKAWCIGF